MKITLVVSFHFFVKLMCRSYAPELAGALVKGKFKDAGITEQKMKVGGVDTIKVGQTSQ